MKENELVLKRWMNFKNIRSILNAGHVVLESNVFDHCAMEGVVTNMNDNSNVLHKAIVCGATGFIGSWLTEELLARNVSVIAIVRNKDGIAAEYMENSNFSYIESEFDKLSDLDIDSCGIDCFYYLAWAGVSGKEKNNLAIQMSNIAFAVEAIKLAKKVSAKKFIATGTVAEYVFSRGLIDTNNKQTPNDIYGATKVAVHYYLDVLSRQLDQPFIWALCPSTYGERRKQDNILSYTILSLLHGEKPQYGDLNQMWDFLYVGDVAKALYYLGLEGHANKVYGIGSGGYKPLREYIYMIRDMINPEAPIGIGALPEMSLQTLNSCVNIFDILQDTHFVPETSFQKGIEVTIKYYKNMLEGTATEKRMERKKSVRTLELLMQSSDLYAPYTGVALISYLEHNKDMDKIIVHFISDGVSNKNLNRLKNTVEKYNRVIHIYDAQDIVDEIEDAGLNKYHGSYTTYCKLFIIDKISFESDRVLYVDSDTLCNGSLMSLLDMELDDYLCAMALCWDSWLAKSINPNSYKRFRYNGGVILFNTDAWKEKECLKFIRIFVKECRPQLLLAEQDILNLLFMDKIKRLHQKYNFVYTYTIMPIKYGSKVWQWDNSMKKEIEEERPLIFHCMPIFGRHPWDDGAYIPPMIKWDYFHGLYGGGQRRKRNKALLGNVRSFYIKIHPCSFIIFFIKQLYCMKSKMKAKTYKVTV